MDRSKGDANIRVCISGSVEYIEPYAGANSIYVLMVNSEALIGEAMRKYSNSVLAIITALIIANTAATSLAEDSDSPMTVVKAFISSIDSGNQEATAKLVADPEKCKDELSALVAVGQGSKSLYEAVDDKFGQKAADTMPRFSKKLELFKDADQKIDGDSCTITAKNRAGVIKLQHIHGIWKIDVKAMDEFKDPKPAIEELQKTATIFKDVAKAVEQGQAKSMEEVQKLLKEKLGALDR